MEDLALIKAVNHSGSFGKNFVMFMKKTELLFTGLGRSVLGKTMPSVLSTARGRRLRAVLKTSGIVFPNTDRPRRANNIYMCTWNRTESYWPCEVHVYWSACFFNWKTKIQRITIPLPWYLWFIGFRLTTICFTQGWTLPWKKKKSRSWRYRCEPTKVISSSVN